MQTNGITPSILGTGLTARPTRSAGSEDTQSQVQDGFHPTEPALTPNLIIFPEGRILPDTPLAGHQEVRLPSGHSGSKPPYDTSFKLKDDAVYPQELVYRSLLQE